MTKTEKGKKKTRFFFPPQEMDRKYLFQSAWKWTPNICSAVTIYFGVYAEQHAAISVWKRLRILYVLPTAHTHSYVCIFIWYKIQILHTKCLHEGCNRIFSEHLNCGGRKFKDKKSVSYREKQWGCEFRSVCRLNTCSSAQSLRLPLQSHLPLPVSLHRGILTPLAFHITLCLSRRQSTPLT